MSISKKRKENIEMFLAEFESYAPAGETLRTAADVWGYHAVVWRCEWASGILS